MQLKENNTKKIHIHLISDSTGETVSTVARSAGAHFKNFDTIEHNWVLVRSIEQINKILEEIKENKGLVIFTLIDKSIRKSLEAGCKRIGVPAVPILDQVVMTIEEFFKYDLAIDEPGRQHALSSNYFDRIGAMQYTLAHDDGQQVHNLNEAEIVLVGVSRTSKTPTSMYLANRGIKVANVPIVPRLQLPEALVRKGLFVVGLTTSPERLKQIRKSRLNAVGESNETEYIKEELIEEEVLRAKKLFNQHGWPSIDVTRKSIEETAAAVLDLLRIFKERNQFESSNKK